MASVEFKQCQALLGKYLDPGVQWSPELDSQLRVLVREHQECAQEYDRVVTVHRLMVGGNPMMPSGFERNRMMRAVVEPVAAPERKFAIFPIPISFGALAAGALAALLIMVIPPQMTQKDIRVDDYYGARGVLGPDLRAGIGVSGVTEDGQEYEVLEAGNKVYIGDYLRVYTTRLDPSLSHAFVFAVLGDGEPIWYWPNPTEGEGRFSVPVNLGVSVPLGGGNEAFEMELAVRHRVGRMSVIALFTREAVQLDSIQDALDRRPADVKMGQWLTETLSLNTTDIVSVLDLEVAQGTRMELEDE